LTGGLRYTSESKALKAITILNATRPTPIVLPTNDQAGTFKKLTWRAALSQDIGDSTMLFASYNRGFKSGGFNSAVVQSYAPEVLDAYEVGIKSTLLDKRLRLNVAGFYYDYSNIQVTSFVAGRQTVNNGGAAELYGVDVDFEASLTDEFTVFGGLEWLHARFTDYRNAPISSPLPAGGSTFTPGDATGFHLPRASDLTFNVGATYAKEVSFGKITASGVYSYNDGFFAQADNRLRQPAYETVNLSLGVELENGLGLSVWGKNLTDSRYAVALGARGAGDFIQYADPRTFGATASIKF
jgi:iron complex outermembrane receptor protein